jgi:hypothetical protein
MSREWLVRCCARSSSFHQFSVYSLGLQGLQRKAFSQEVGTPANRCAGDERGLQKQSTYPILLGALKDFAAF